MHDKALEDRDEDPRRELRLQEEEHSEGMPPHDRPSTLDVLYDPLLRGYIEFDLQGSPLWFYPDSGKGPVRLRQGAEDG